MIDTMVTIVTFWHLVSAISNQSNITVTNGSIWTKTPVNRAVMFCMSLEGYFAVCALEGLPWFHFISMVPLSQSVVYT